MNKQKKRTQSATVWIAIMILSITQFITTYNNYQIHVQLWEAVIKTNKILSCEIKVNHQPYKDLVSDVDNH